MPKPTATVTYPAADLVAAAGREIPITRRAEPGSGGLLTMPHVRRDDCALTVTHELPLPRMCPVSGNPAPGSVIRVRYQPNGRTLEVVALRDYLEAFVGGRRVDGEDVVSMEQVPERLAVHAAAALAVAVQVDADLVIEPGQRMAIVVTAGPPAAPGRTLPGWYPHWRSQP